MTLIFPIKDSQVCRTQHQNQLICIINEKICGKGIGLFSHRCEYIIALPLCRWISSAYEARLQRTLIPAAVTDSGAAKQPPNSSAHYTMQAVACTVEVRCLIQSCKICVVSGRMSLHTFVAAAESIRALFLREFRALMVNWCWVQPKTTNRHR